MGVASLRKYLIDLLSGREDKRQLSVLSEEEVYLLAIMRTTADVVRQINPTQAAILDTLIDNHLALRVSVHGAGRKDLKDVLLNREFTPLPTRAPIPPEGSPIDVGEKKEKKGFLSRIF